MGISLIANTGSGNRIYDNTVNGVYFPTAPTELECSQVKCGLHLENSPNVSMCGNDVDGLYRGAHLAGPLEYCDFSKNIINENYYGIHCRLQSGNDPTTMGHQFWHENEWTEIAYQGLGAFYEDGDPDFIFRVDITVQSNFMPPSAMPPLWFLPVIKGEEDDDNSECIGETEPPPRVNGPRIKNYLRRINICFTSS